MRLSARAAGHACAMTAAAVLLTGALAANAAPRPAPRPDASQAKASCPQSQREFTPTAVSIAGVTRSRRVLALGRDRQGVPKPPPLTGRGRWQFAWDRRSGVGAGSTEGVVRLTAHTYPARATELPALGNLLLSRLHRGDHLRVTGRHGSALCYRVSRRVQVAAASTLPGYYSSSGPPRLAILVCSGTRRGPGDWSRRTIWYAVPVGPGS